MAGAFSTDLKVWCCGTHAKMLQSPTLFGDEATGRIVAVREGVKDWQVNTSRERSFHPLHAKTCVRIDWQVGDRVVANNSAPDKCFYLSLK